MCFKIFVILEGRNNFNNFNFNLIILITIKHNKNAHVLSIYFSFTCYLFWWHLFPCNSDVLRTMFYSTEKVLNTSREVTTFEHSQVSTSPFEYSVFMWSLGRETSSVLPTLQPVMEYFRNIQITKRFLYFWHSAPIHLQTFQSPDP